MTDENITPGGGFDPKDIEPSVPDPSPPEPSVPSEPDTHGGEMQERIERDASDVENSKKPLPTGSFKSIEKGARHDAAKDRLKQDEFDMKHGRERGVNESRGRHGTQAEVEEGLARTTHDTEKAAEIAALIAATVATGGAAAGGAAAAEGGGAAVAGTAAAAEGAAAGTAAGAGAGTAAAGTTAAEGTAAAARAGATAATSSSEAAAAGTSAARTAGTAGAGAADASATANAATQQGSRAAAEASKAATKTTGAASEKAVGEAAKQTGEKAATSSASKAATAGEAPAQGMTADIAAERAGTQSAQQSAKNVAGDSNVQRKKIVEAAKKKAKEEGKKQGKKHARELADGTKRKKGQARKDRKKNRYDQQVQAEHALSERRSAKYAGGAGAAGAGLAGGAAAGAAGAGTPGGVDPSANSMSGKPGDETVAITSDSRWDKKGQKQATEQSQTDKLAHNRAVDGKKSKKNKNLSDKDARKDLLKQEAKTRNKDKSGPDHRGHTEKRADKKQEKTGRNPKNVPIVGGISRGKMAVDRQVKSTVSAGAAAAGMALFTIMIMLVTTVTSTTGSNQASQNSQQNAASSAFIAMSFCLPGEGTSGGGGNDGGDVGPVDPTKEAQAKAVYKIFSGMGMPDISIAGILGNWDQESGVDPTSVQGIFNEPYKIGPTKIAKLALGGNNYGIGYGQWTADRNTMLRDYAKEKGKDWYDPSLQLNFMTDPQGDNASDVAILQGMIDNPKSSPKEAALYFESAWERAGKPNPAARIAAADKWYKQMDSWEEGSGSETEEETDTQDDTNEDSEEVDTQDEPSEDTDSGNETSGEAPHWSMPMKDEDYSTSSGYGPRTSPTAGASSWHKGADFAGADGKPIFAAGDGTVIKAGASSGFGNWVVIDHEYKGDKYSTVYGHMRGNTIKVEEGQKVKAGQQIAAVGSEGFSTGPHLHFEIWDGGRFGGNHVNPVKFLNKVGATDDNSGAEGPDGPGNGGGDDDNGGSSGNCANGLLSWLFPGGGGDDSGNGGGDDKGKKDEGDDSTEAGDTELQNKSIAAGKTQLGIPYSWGGGGLEGPTEGFAQGAGITGFDCSSFVRYAYYQGSGGKIEMPRTASAQQSWSGMKDIKKDELQPGDLIYFGSPATHVAMYVGNGKMMQAPQTGDVVKISQFEGSSYWDKKHQDYRRVTP